MKSDKRFLITVLASIGMVLVSESAAAEPVTYEFTGVATSVDGAWDVAGDIGSPVSGFFTFDTELRDFEPTDSQYDRFEAYGVNTPYSSNWEISVTMGGLTGTTATNRNEAGDYHHLLQITNGRYSDSWKINSACRVITRDHGAEISLRDVTPSSYPGPDGIADIGGLTGVPFFPADISLFDWATGWFSFLPCSDQDGEVRFNITSITPRLTEPVVPACGEDHSQEIMSYWKADGDASDSVDGMHGTLSGGMSFEPEGVVGPAFQLDGIDDYVDLGTNPNLGPTGYTDADFTFEAWFRTNDDSTIGYIIDSRNPFTTTGLHDGFYVVVDARSGQKDLAFGISDSSNSLAHQYNVQLKFNVDIEAANDGNWHHVAMVKEGSLLRSYFDGIERDAGDLSTIITADISNNVHYLGKRNSPDGWVNFFNGDIDEAALYHRALTPQEIYQHYINGLNGEQYCTPEPSPEFNTFWDASSGYLPDAACTAWTHDTGGNALLPYLSGGVLTLDSSATNSDFSYYYQRGLPRQDPPTISIPETLVIETMARYVSGATSSPTTRTHLGIGFETEPDNKNVLFIGNGEIYLLAGDAAQGTWAAVETDLFNTYRIEVQKSDGAIEVFVNDSPTPTLTGQTYNTSNASHAENIWFGDGTTVSRGVSDFVFFRHNAGIAGACTGIPVADAGDDQTEHPGILVTLDGSGSSDPGGHYPLSFDWQLADQPVGSTATLSGDETVNPVFTPDLMGDYTVRLVVTNTEGFDSLPDSVVISTYNTAPVADAGADQAIIQIGTTVDLGSDPGRQSYDEDGDDFNYDWQMTQKPTASAAELVDTGDPSAPYFVADVHGDYEVTLVVTDVFGAASDPDTVIISFDNVRPVADAGGNQSVVVDDFVSLNGTGSYDENLDPLEYRWSFVSKPFESLAELSNPTSDTSSFTADEPGLYVVSLVVTDGFEDSAPSNIEVVAITTQEAAAQTLMLTVTAVNELTAGDFKNKNLGNALTNKINSALAMIDEGSYAEALNKLSHDILGKTNGCAQASEPDRNDWITTCEEQAPVYSMVMDAIAYLQEAIE